MIRSANVGDTAELCDIYNHYVLNTSVTFEEQAVTVEEMVARVQETLPSLPWLVVEDSAHVLGFCYASKWKGRCAYRYSAEATAYLRPDATGKGLGRQLYLELLKQLKDRGFHAVIGGIALPNDASVALHEKLGFAKVALFRQVGHKFGNWIDVGYWQLLFDLR